MSGEAVRLVPPLLTRRLILRRPDLGDAGALTRALAPLHMSRWLGIVPHPYTARHAREFLAQACAVEATGGDIVRTIVRRDNPRRIVGVVGLTREGDTLLSLGYWIAREEQGRGLAREAALAMVDFGFATRPVVAIVATVMPDNVASRRVLEAAGLVRQHRRLMLWCRALGVKRPVLDYRLERRAWAAKRKMTTVEAIARYGLSTASLRETEPVAS